MGDIHSRFSSLDALRATFTTCVVGAMMDSIMVAGLLLMLILYGGKLTVLYWALQRYMSSFVY